MTNHPFSRPRSRPHPRRTGAGAGARIVRVGLALGSLLAGACGEPDAGSEPASRERVLAGRVTADSGGLRLEPCEGGAGRELVGTPTSELSGLVAELGPAVHVELVGQPRPDGTVRLARLRFVAPASESWCGRDEGDAEVVASGNEPFWRARVVGDQLVVDRPDEPTSWRSRGAGADLELRDEPCRDGMSGAWSHLTATLVLDGQVFDGCGRRVGAP